MKDLDKYIKESILDDDKKTIQRINNSVDRKIAEWLEEHVNLNLISNYSAKYSPLIPEYYEIKNGMIYIKEDINIVNISIINDKSIPKYIKFASLGNTSSLDFEHTLSVKELYQVIEHVDCKFTARLSLFRS